jgi:hypothetical protein
VQEQLGSYSYTVLAGWEGDGDWRGITVVVGGGERMPVKWCTNWSGYELLTEDADFEICNSLEERAWNL